MTGEQWRCLSDLIAMPWRDSRERGPQPPGLIPDDLRWSWCNNNRNKVHNKCIHLNHPETVPPSPIHGKNDLASNWSLVPKSLGIFKGMFFVLNTRAICLLTTPSHKALTSLSVTCLFPLWAAGNTPVLRPQVLPGCWWSVLLILAL